MVYLVKCFIGCCYEEGSIELKCVFYKVVKGSNGDAYIEVCGKTMVPFEVSVKVL